ncbi:hypothetical protein EYF80_029277 [Liparis tanakae]|uniref:Uncharacterized protein n=1 Tax=Liparis tanakae TaxID=230148 RepID=A0A4Z2H6W3_9TELE|nr:hypothetical protein EYF80_029277 [Liparis tanakae]
MRPWWTATPCALRQYCMEALGSHWFLPPTTYRTPLHAATPAPRRATDIGHTKDQRLDSGSHLQTERRGGGSPLHRVVVGGALRAPDGVDAAVHHAHPDPVPGQAQRGLLAPLRSPNSAQAPRPLHAEPMSASFSQAFLRGSYASMESREYCCRRGPCGV